MKNVKYSKSNLSAYTPNPKFVLRNQHFKIQQTKRTHFPNKFANSASVITVYILLLRVCEMCARTLFRTCAGHRVTKNVLKQSEKNNMRRKNDGKSGKTTNASASGSRVGTGRVCVAERIICVRDEFLAGTLTRAPQFSVRTRLRFYF